MYKDCCAVNSLSCEVQTLLTANLVTLAYNFEVGRIVKLLCVFLYRSFLESRECNSVLSSCAQENFLALAVEFL